MNLFEKFFYSDAYEIFKMCLIGLLVVGLLVGFVFLCLAYEDTKVDAVVISCVEGDDYVNYGAKTMGTFYTAQGKFTQGMAFNAMAQPQDRYVVVAEYNGEQFEIETSKPYEVGEIIRVQPPK